MKIVFAFTFNVTLLRIYFEVSLRLFLGKFKTTQYIFAIKSNKSFPEYIFDFQLFKCMNLSNIEFNFL